MAAGGQPDRRAVAIPAQLPLGRVGPGAAGRRPRSSAASAGGRARSRPVADAAGLRAPGHQALAGRSGHCRPPSQPPRARLLADLARPAAAQPDPHACGTPVSGRAHRPAPGRHVASVEPACAGPAAREQGRQHHPRRQRHPGHRCAAAPRALSHRHRCAQLGAAAWCGTPAGLDRADGTRSIRDRHRGAAHGCGRRQSWRSARCPRPGHARPARGAGAALARSDRHKPTARAAGRCRPA